MELIIPETDGLWKSKTFLGHNLTAHILHLRPSQHPRIAIKFDLHILPAIMRFTSITTLFLATASFSMAADEPTETTCKAPSQPDRKVPAYGPTQTLYGQCGGQDYTGRTKCEKPFVCKELNAYYSQCLEDPSATKPDDAAQTHYGQCGGKDYKGPTKCAEPWTCKKQMDNDYYSQCL
jgi:hypothetical protein